MKQKIHRGISDFWREKIESVSAAKEECRGKAVTDLKRP
jgi:hypothetical protein